MATLILMVGPSGSGKTTWVKGNSKAQVVSADQIRAKLTGDTSNQTRNPEVFRVLRRRVARLLNAGRDVLVDNTNVQPFARVELLNIARDLGAEVAVYVMQTPLEECLRRNALRDRVVPEEAIRRQYAAFLESLEGLPREYPQAVIKLI